jgi:hypothetical protein
MMAHAECGKGKNRFATPTPRCGRPCRTCRWDEVGGPSRNARALFRLDLPHRRNPLVAHRLPLAVGRLHRTVLSFKISQGSRFGTKAFADCLKQGIRHKRDGSVWALFGNDVLARSVTTELDVGQLHSRNDGIRPNVRRSGVDPVQPLPKTMLSEQRRRIGLMASRGRILLEPGHETEWAAINREEAEQLRASNMALTPAQRLEQGQKLSQQAVSLLVASVKAGHVPERALWT